MLCSWLFQRCHIRRVNIVLVKLQFLCCTDRLSISNITFLTFQGYLPTPMHSNRRIALDCEDDDAAYAELACATKELKFYKDNVDPADMTSLKKPTTEHEPVLKFKSAHETKLVDFVLDDSSKQFSISANLDPK